MVYASSGNRTRIVARSAAAEAQGVRPGMPLAEAESLLAAEDVPPLLIPHDPEADREELQRLALACAPFGPTVGLEQDTEPESIFVETTGCESFFGGEMPLMQGALRLLAAEGYLARAGMAETIGQAWAAARLAGRNRITWVPPGRGAQWLARQSVALLRLEERLLGTLQELGLKRVGALERLPRAEIPSRFGSSLLERLDQAMGRRGEAIEPLRPPVDLSEEWSGESPLTSLWEIERVLGRQVERLLGRVVAGEGVSALHLAFGDDLARSTRPAAPVRGAERLLVLLSFLLERMPPPAEVFRVLLTAETAPLPAPVAGRLFEFEGDEAGLGRRGGQAFEELLERLGSRLGRERVVRGVFEGDPIPERSWQWRSALEARGAGGTSQFTPPEVFGASSRPILLLDPPERVVVTSEGRGGPPCRLDRQGRSVALSVAIGPERITSGWDAGAEVRRDYWRIETESAERLWVFRCRRSGRWFLQGLFG